MYNIYIYIYTLIKLNAEMVLHIFAILPSDRNVNHRCSLLPPVHQESVLTIGAG